MRIFGHSQYGDPWWDYMHNGYISATPSENDRYRARGLTVKGTEPASTKTRVTVSETVNTDWWDNAQASYLAGEAPEAVKPLMEGEPEVVIADDDAAAIQKWATSLPSWKTGIAVAPDPLEFSAG